MEEIVGLMFFTFIALTQITVFYIVFHVFGHRFSPNYNFDDFSCFFDARVPDKESVMKLRDDFYLVRFKNAQFTIFVEKVVENFKL